ncbi:hypothetical protein, partial [Actinacidiphila rubida]|uniref:hypothetical protein n=1 Tax=Actinacidiphila rubida TaxID=310780 RepID=UPI000A703800
PGAGRAVAQQRELVGALLADGDDRAGRAAAYVCRHFVCDAPTSEPRTLRSQLRSQVWTGPRRS